MGTVPVYSDLDFQSTYDPINTSSPIGGGGGGGSVSFDAIEPSRIILKANNNGINFDYIDPGEKDIILSTASVDPDSGYNAGTGEYTFARDTLVFLQAQVQYDWTSGVGRENGILKINFDTGGGYNNLYFTDNFGGSNHEKDSFVTSGLYQASAGDKVKATFEATASSNIPIDGDDESTFFSITEVVNSSVDGSPKLLLLADNNGTPLTHTGGGSAEDLIFSNASVDADSGYNATTGEYTFSEDMTVLVIGQVSNDDPNGGAFDGYQSVDIELDTGGGFTQMAIGEDYSGDGHTGNNQDSVYVVYCLEVSSGDVVKLTSRNNKGGSWTYSGSPHRTFFQILQLVTPDVTDTNANRLLLSAHNNGVAITHTAAPGYEDILWSTSPVDPESAYNSGTGEYTLPVGGRFLVIAQVRDNESTNSIYEEMAIEIDTGGGFNIETRWQRFNGNGIQGMTVPVWNIFELDAGDIIKTSLYADDSGTFFGDSASAFFQIIDISAGTGFASIKEALAEPRTYYVDTAGLDINDGLTPATAVQTIARGLELALSVDPRSFRVTVELAAGDYTSQSTNLLLPKGTGPDYRLKGASAGTAILPRTTVSGAGNRWGLEDLVFDSTGIHLGVTNGASAQLYGNIEVRGDGTGGFDPHFFLDNSATLTANAITIDINNSSIPPTTHNTLYYVQQNSTLAITNSTVDFLNAIQYDYTVLCLRASVMNVEGTTWVGGGNITNNTAAAGAIQGNATILEFGATIPGSLANSIEAATFCTLI